MNKSETRYTSETIYEFSLSETEILRISFVTANGSNYLDLRRWGIYRGRPWPTKGGVRVCAQVTPQLTRGLRKAEMRLSKRAANRRTSKEKVGE